MSYTPTEWEPTDVVTATRMNALEQAVGDMNMSYTPNTWSDGDILSAEKTNALEQAVASGGGGSSDYLVLTEDPETGALDKTWQEINDAMESATVIVLAGTSSWVVSGAIVDEGFYFIALYNNGQASQSGTYEAYYAESPNDYPVLD